MRVIIPAAGKAERFGGILKELLPLDKSGAYFGLSNAISQAVLSLDADEICVISSVEKVGEQAKAVYSHACFHETLRFLIQKNTLDLWGAICTGLWMNKSGALILPDTTISIYIPDDILFSAPFVLGTFKTNHSERYSIIKDGFIQTKPCWLSGEHIAWGFAMWNQDVTNFWLSHNYGLDFKHYDHAFNAAIKQFGLTTFELLEYKDIGTIEGYWEFIHERYNK